MRLKALSPHSLIFLFMSSSEFHPNLFILGAAKCGSTTLHAMLDKHPDACMADPKEPFFYETEFGKGQNFNRERYFSHFSGESVIGESRHRNLYLPYVAERIHETNPEAKLVVILRDPVARAFSHWMMLHRNGDEDLSFEKAIQEDLARIRSGKRMTTQEEQSAHDENLERPGRRHGLGIYRTYLDTGYYAEQIQVYLNLFRRDQLHVIIFEEFIKDQEKILKEVLAFVGLDQGRMGELSHTQEGAAPPQVFRSEIVKTLVWRWGLAKLVPKRIKLWISKKGLKTAKEKHFSEKMISELTAHFQVHNEALEKLLGRKLPWRS